MDGGGAPAIRSTCPYCGVGCGVLLTPDGAGGLGVRGDPDHPANRGRLCTKGAALGETLGREGRLLRPRVHGRDAGWDEALGLVAERFRATIAAHGPDAVAFYVSGQMLTEDYYVANKLMKGFVGSANIDTNSRLCMASTVAGHRRAFGADTVPGTYEDLEEADLVVLVGSNLAWCHPVLHQRIEAARAARPAMRVVVVDPRRTATAEAADLHLPLAIGSDVALFNGLLAAIHDAGAADARFLARVDGFDDAVRAARGDDADATGLPRNLLARFFRLWIGTRKVVTVFSQGVNQSTSGTDKVNAILNCHLATGRIGRPGMGPFSVTGQPNAMGGREVGGLANALACHLDLEDAAHREAVRAFWGAPAVPEAPGLKAVDMFRAVERGEVRAFWIVHTNPAVTMPEADRVRDAIAGCAFTVVSDVTAATDTARLADVLLPAAAWAEKDGTVTNSDRTISRQRAALAPPGEARPDWAILAEVGRRMGWPRAFDYAGPAEIFREHAALSGVAGRLGRDFDVSALADHDAAAYDALPPTRWPVTAARRGGRFFADGRFFTPSGRGRMVAVSSRPPAAAPAEGALRLNTGRVRDHWHTMTRTGRAPRLSRHLAEPYLDVHPGDAARLGLAPAALAEVRGGAGRCVLRVRVTDAVRPGEAFAPIHWSGETAPTGRIDALVPAEVDPLSGQPESKAAVVSVRPFAARWFAFAACAGPRPAPEADYWALAPAEGGWRVEMAGREPPPDWEAAARTLFGLPHAEAQSVTDPARGLVRLAFREGGRLRAVLFAGPEPVTAARDHVAGLLGTGASALPGRPGADRPDPGPTVCACLHVGANTILAAVEDGRAASVEAVGAALGAGTSCGACRPQIAALIARAAPRVAAE